MLPDKCANRKVISSKNRALDTPPPVRNFAASIMDIDFFTGGPFDTNCFFLRDHGILIDAPQGAAAWLEKKGYRTRTLLLTHAHIDHVWDAAAIARASGCKVGYHADGVPMLTTPGYFKQFGYNWDIDMVPADFLIDETPSLAIEGVEFQVLLVPGHCPGSLCFLEKTTRMLFGGDVLFAGSIGRTDLPGGDHDLLLRCIREKLWPLGNNVTVLPGHGPATTIGEERRTNPYVGDAA